jgi:hypothetical protein
MSDAARDNDDIEIPDIKPLESRYLQISNSITSIESRLQELMAHQEQIQKNSHLWVLNDNSLGNLAGTIASRIPTLGEMHSASDTNNQIIQELLDE